MTTMERFRRVAFGVCLCLGSVVPAVASPVVYNNGPINGTVNAWDISGGFSVTDSFTLTELTTLDKVRVGLWTNIGPPLSLNWSIGTAAFGADVSALAVAPLSVTQIGTLPNAFGYNVYAASWDLTGPMLNAGTYWLTLQNTLPDPIFWDQNDGPSTARQYDPLVPGVADLAGSNSFQLFGTSPGNGTGDVPEPGTLALAAIAAIALAAQRRQRS